jgi:hypothetical protein
VTIEVRDDGPGVPPDKLPHIFERFYRAADTRAPRSARPPGSGLGLAIAAEIAAAHGGAGLPPRPARNPDLPRPPGEPGIRRRRRFRGSVTWVDCLEWG